jgi:hypothetical protein
MTKQYPMTIWKLSWGSGPINETRYFPTHKNNDVLVMFAHKVQMFDGDPTVSAAWVHFGRCPDSVYPDGMTLAAWTKTSDECATVAGFKTPEECLEHARLGRP